MSCRDRTSPMGGWVVVRRAVPRLQTSQVRNSSTEHFRMKACTCRPHTPDTPIRPPLPTYDPPPSHSLTSRHHSRTRTTWWDSSCANPKMVCEIRKKRLNNNKGNSWLRTKLMVDRGFSSHPGMHLQCVGSVLPAGATAESGHRVQLVCRIRQHLSTTVSSRSTPESQHAATRGVNQFRCEIA